MTEDLVLFLGANTKVFTEWLVKRWKLYIIRWVKTAIYIKSFLNWVQGLFKNYIQFGKTSIKYMEIQSCAPSLIEESSVVWDWEIQAVPHTLFIK